MTMKPHYTTLLLTATLAAFCWAALQLPAATRAKADNPAALNLASSWTNNLPPGTADVALFDGTVTAPLTVALGVDLAWNQINFINPGGDFAISAGHRLTLSNNTPITFGAGTANLTFDCDLYCAGASFTTLPAAPTNRTVTYNGAIQGRNATVTLGNNTGTLRLGSPSSTLIGSVVQVTTANLKLGVGASSVGDPIASGPLGTSLFTWGATSAGTELFAYNGDQTLGNAVRVQFSPLNFNSADDLTFTGVVDLNNGNRTVSVSSNGALRFTGVISNATGLTKTGPGTLALGGTNVAAFNNGLSIFGGTVRLLASEVIPNSGGTVRMTNVAQILDLNGFSDTIRGLSAANGAGNWVGTIDNTAPDTTSVLTLGDQFTYTLHGKFQNSGPGAKLALVKNGTGGLIVSNANTFSGGFTNASAGQIHLNTVGAAGTGPVVLAHTNAALTYSGGGSITWTNSIVVQADTQPGFSAKDGSALEISGVISGPGPVWLPDNLFERGPITLSGANTFSGGLLLAGGAVRLNHPHAAGIGPLIVGDPLYYAGGSLTLIPGTNLAGANAITNAAVFNRNFTIGGTEPVEFAGPVALAFTSPQVSINVTNPAGATISGPISGDGFGFNKTGEGLLTLNGISTYTGRTSLSVGDMALGPGAALTGTSEIFSGGGTVLDVTGAGGLTIGPAQTLRGYGSLVGDVTVEGALKSFGFFFGFTFSNNLTLRAGSTTTATISRDAIPLDPQIVCVGTLTFGGELIVQNFSDAPQAGDVFHLFSFGAPAGAFDRFTLPDLDAGLAWDTGRLSVDGTITVASTGPPQPQLSSPQLLNGTNFVLTVSSGTPNGQFRVLTQTNVEAAVINWEVLSTNTYDGSGTLTVTNPINPAEPKRFFRAVEP